MPRSAQSQLATQDSALMINPDPFGHHPLLTIVSSSNSSSASEDTRLETKSKMPAVSFSTNLDQTLSGPLNAALSLWFAIEIK